MSDLDNLNLEDFEKQLADAKADLTKMEETHSKTMDSKLTDQVENTIKDSTSEEESQPKYTEQEQEAIKQGWNPNHKGANPKTAEQFLHDGSFFKKIDHQNKKIEDLTSTVKALLEHNTKLEELKFKEGYQKALSERNRAIEEGNVQAFNYAEEKLKQQVEAHKSLPKVTNEPSIPQETLDLLHKFKDKNSSWFAASDVESKEMTDLAAAYDQYNLNKGKSQAESLKEVENLIKLKFPHRFENKEQEKAPSVAKSTVSTSSSKSNTSFDKLTDQQKWVFKQCKAIDPKLDKEKYAKQILTRGVSTDE